MAMTWRSSLSIARRKGLAAGKPYPHGVCANPALSSQTSCSLDCSGLVFPLLYPRLTPAAWLRGRSMEEQWHQVPIGGNRTIAQQKALLEWE